MRSSIDDIIDLYKQKVDRDALRESLKLTPTERIQACEEALRKLDGPRERAPVGPANPAWRVERSGGNSIDDIIEVYKRDVDRAMIREALKLTPSRRLELAEQLLETAAELGRALGRTRERVP